MSTTHLDYAFCHFMLVSTCCNLMGAGQGVCQIPSRHAGNFVFSGKVKINPFSLNVYSLAQSLYYACSVWERGVGGEIFNSFSLTLVAVLQHMANAVCYT